MRLLFSVNNFGFLRNFEPALRQLAARGHDISPGRRAEGQRRRHATIDKLARDFTRAHHAQLRAEPEGRISGSRSPCSLRLCLDYWRYLDARYDNSPSLRARAARPGAGVRLAAAAARRSSARGRRWRLWAGSSAPSSARCRPGDGRSVAAREHARSAARDAAPVFRLAAGRIRPRGEGRSASARCSASAAGII